MIVSYTIFVFIASKYTFWCIKSSLFIFPFFFLLIAGQKEEEREAKRRRKNTRPKNNHYALTGIFNVGLMPNLPAVLSQERQTPKSCARRVVLSGGKSADVSPQHQFSLQPKADLNNCMLFLSFLWYFLCDSF